MIVDYILQKIQHSGRKGIRGTDCTDFKYYGLIGYKCHIDIDEIQQFKSYEFIVDSLLINLTLYEKNNIRRLTYLSRNGFEKTLYNPFNR